ncbi:MAG: hypothetical protein IPJ88_01875 [Myxococcales bacterium]|nr:MAG: hypothetical protein IPJ88_01875 [Myxococcales bacterium]
MKSQRFWMFCLLFVMLPACQKNGPGASDELIAKLRANMDKAPESEAQVEDLNSLAKEIVEKDAFGDMRRFEVQGKIGKGEPCSRHPDCMQRGFDADDWVYTIGQQPESGVYFLPMLFIGFDREGHHSRSHYIVRDIPEETK